MLKFRNLKASEIDCRVASVKKNGCSLLLYKDARCDMRILDETVGPERWQRTHELINGNLFCSVGINFPDDNGDHWIWKQDVGTESYTEKEKGQASDAFKRACFNWGIGRELYTAPFIWIPTEKVKINESNGRFTVTEKFFVSGIQIEDGEIVELSLINSKGKKIFSWPQGQRNTEAGESAEAENEHVSSGAQSGFVPATAEQLHKIEEFVDAYVNLCEGVTATDIFKKLKDMYNFSHYSDISKYTADKMIAQLEFWYRKKKDGG